MTLGFLFCFSLSFIHFSIGNIPHSHNVLALKIENNKRVRVNVNGIFLTTTKKKSIKWNQTEKIWYTPHYCPEDIYYVNIYDTTNKSDIY